MLYELGKYGGLVTIVLSWTTLVLPFLILRNGKNWKYLSQTAINGFWGIVFKIGVVACGIFQILFAYFLYQNFSNNISRLGIEMYGLASASFLCCGLITYYGNRRVHTYFLKSYYILMSLGFLLLSLDLTLFAEILAILLIVVPVYLGEFRRKHTAFDIVTIVLSNFFALSIYQSLGIINLV